MKAARKSIAFASGILLYCFCAGAAMKYASTGLPRQWYAALGGRNSLPVALGEAIAIALLLVVIAVIWGFVTLKPSRRRHRPYIAWFLWGIGVAWAGWLIFGAFSFAMKPRSYSQPLQSLLLSSNAAPLFGAFNIFGVLTGAWLAGKLAKKRQLSLPSTRSRRRQADDAADAAADSAAGKDSGVSTISPPAV